MKKMWIIIAVIVIVSVGFVLFKLKPQSKIGSGVLPRLSGLVDKRVEEKINNKLTDIESSFSCRKNIQMEDLRFDYLTLLIKEWRESQGLTDLNVDISPEKFSEFFEKSELASKSEMESRLAQFEIRKPEVTAFQEKQIYSLHIAMFYDCQVYPLERLSYRDASVTFDLITGKTIPFTDLFDNFKKDERSILTAVFAHNEPVPVMEKSSTKDSSRDMCEGDPSNFFDDEAGSFTYYLSEKGLTVEHRSSAHGILSSCLNRSTLPISEFQKLEKYLAKDSILGRFFSR